MDSKYINLMIARLPRCVTNSDLLHLFQPLGATSATVMVNTQTGISKGFGFVLFASEDEGRAACEALHGKDVTLPHRGGVKFRIVASPSRHNGNIVAARPDIFVRNIPCAMPREKISELLNKSGAIEAGGKGGLVDWKARKVSRMWVVHATYDSVEHARVAINALHQTSLKGYEKEPLVLAKYADTTTSRWDRFVRRHGAESSSVYRHNPYTFSGIEYLPRDASVKHTRAPPIPCVG